MALLRVAEVSKRFGGLQAVRKVSLDVDEGEVLGLIGPNGSGKTTLINILTGVYPPNHGTVELDGRTVIGMRPYELVSRGLSRTFQSARVFDTVTVRQNMMVPVLHERESAATLDERADELLGLVGLLDQADQAASELSGGQQRLLEFARAMMTEPKVVLMDEPFAGIHPEIKRSLLASLRTMKERGTTFVVVSHEIPVITSIADELVCLANGEVIARGHVERVIKAPEVVTAYLGTHQQES